MTAQRFTKHYHTRRPGRPTIMTNLSQELLDAIVDQVEDSQHNAWSCIRTLSLVSPVFVAPAQRRIFRSITLGTGMSASPKARVERLNVLLMASPHLAFYIQDLKILSILHWEDAQYSLQIFLRSLPNVVCMYISSDCWTEISPGIRSAIQDIIMQSSLQQLLLRGEHPHTLILRAAAKSGGTGRYDVLLMNPAFTAHLERLRITTNGFRFAVAQRVLTAVGPILCHLEVRMGGTSLTNLPYMPHAHTIEFLDLTTGNAPERLSPIIGQLSIATPHLEVIIIHCFHHPLGSSKPISPIPIQSFPHLQHVDCRITLPRGVTPFAMTDFRSVMEKLIPGLRESPFCNHEPRFSHHEHCVRNISVETTQFLVINTVTRNGGVMEAGGALDRSFHYYRGWVERGARNYIVSVEWWRRQLQRQTRKELENLRNHADSVVLRREKEGVKEGSQTVSWRRTRSSFITNVGWSRPEYEVRATHSLRTLHILTWKTGHSGNRARQFRAWGQREGYIWHCGEARGWKLGKEGGSGDGRIIQRAGGFADRDWVRTELAGGGGAERWLGSVGILSIEMGARGPAREMKHRDEVHARMDDAPVRQPVSCQLQLVGDLGSKTPRIKGKSRVGAKGKEPGVAGVMLRYLPSSTS
ncbi:hypothetical protein DFH09DRAFT_1110149 [Mycena vulgaris]|nr:hypothetical protein DFH09DRAFT_1110149 [Mycena vulgaris]